MPSTSTAADVLQFPVTKATPKARLTFKDERSLAALKAPKTGAIEVGDAHVKGLSVRITSKNARSFYFRYSNPQKLMKRIVIGEVRDYKLVDARAKVSEYRVILNGAPGVPPRDPAHIREETRTAVTFGTLAEQWFADKAILLKRKGKRERQMYDADLQHWADRPAAEITRAELVDTLNTKTKRGKLVAANRLRALISRIYRFGIASGRIPVSANPVPGTVKHKERPRSRHLALDEVREMWAACDYLPVHHCVFERLRLLTGQRGADIIQMRWADLDKPKKGFWEIPVGFAKNEEPHTVYLSSLAQEQLALLPRRVEDGPFDPTWVFPAGGKSHSSDDTVRNDAAFDVMGDYAKIHTRLQQPSRMPSVKARIDAEKAAGVERKKDKRGWVTRVAAGFTNHDLRRTMNTILKAGGVNGVLASRILNHKKKGGDVEESVYDQHHYNPEKKAIMSFWDTRLRCILAGGDDEAVDALPRFTMDSTLVELQRKNAELEARLVAAEQRAAATA